MLNCSFALSVTSLQALLSFVLTEAQITLRSGTGLVHTYAGLVLRCFPGKELAGVTLDTSVMACCRTNAVFTSSFILKSSSDFFQLAKTSTNLGLS